MPRLRHSTAYVLLKQGFSIFALLAHPPFFSPFICFCVMTYSCCTIPSLNASDIVAEMSFSFQSCYLQCFEVLARKSGPKMQLILRERFGRKISANFQNRLESCLEALAANLGPKTHPQQLCLASLGSKRVEQHLHVLASGVNSGCVWRCYQQYTTCFP